MKRVCETIPELNIRLTFISRGWFARPKTFTEQFIHFSNKTMRGMLGQLSNAVNARSPDTLLSISSM